MKLDKLLNIKYPIIQGGMANISDGLFASQVSEAGALGVIGSGAMDAEELAREIDICREHTDKSFAVNLIMLNPKIDSLIDLVIEKKVELVTTGAGNPGKYMDRLKKAGIKVFPIVPSLTLAKRLARYDIDGLIVEGREAGGHVGNMTSFSLIPEIAEAIDLPIIAAGGIGSGKHILAAQVLGASGVQIGSLFLGTEECPISKNYKELLLKKESKDIITIGDIAAYPTNLIKNKKTRLYRKREKAGASKVDLEKYMLGSLRLAVEKGDLEEGAFMAGLSISYIREILTIRDLLEKLDREYKKELARINGDD